MSIKESVKLQIGITHDKLDSEIARLEKVAKTELKRLGIKQEKIDDNNDSLIEEAVIDFICKFMASDERDRALWERAWDIISTELKDSKEYRTWTVKGENNV